MLESITQQHDYGCGVACVAFVTSKSYKYTLKVLRADAAKVKGFFCKDLVIALSTYGSAYGYKYLKPRLRWRIYEDRVIVYIKKSKHYPA